MQRKEFLEKTVIQLDDDLFGEFKKINCRKIYFIFLYKKRKHYQRNACRKTI